MPRHRPQSIAQTFSGMKAEYAGLTGNRFRRRRPGRRRVGLGRQDEARVEFERAPP